MSLFNLKYLLIMIMSFFVINITAANSLEMGINEINAATTAQAVQDALSDAVSQIQSDYNNVIAASSVYSNVLTSALALKNSYLKNNQTIPASLDSAITTAQTDFPLNSDNSAVQFVLSGSTVNYPNSLPGKAILVLNNAANTKINDLKNTLSPSDIEKIASAIISALLSAGGIFRSKTSKTTPQEQETIEKATTLAQDSNNVANLRQAQDDANAGNMADLNTDLDSLGIDFVASVGRAVVAVAAQAVDLTPAAQTILNNASAQAMSASSLTSEQMVNASMGLVEPIATVQTVGGDPSLAVEVASVGVGANSQTTLQENLATVVQSPIDLKQISDVNSDAYTQLVREVLATDQAGGLGQAMDATAQILDVASAQGFLPNDMLSMIGNDALFPQNFDIASLDRINLLNKVLVDQNITKPSQTDWSSDASFISQVKTASTIQNGLDEAGITIKANQITYKSMLSNIEGELLSPNNTIDDAAYALNNSLKVGNLTADDVLSIISSGDFVTTNVPSRLSDVEVLGYKLSVLTNYVVKIPNAEIDASNIGALSANIQDYNASIVSQYHLAQPLLPEGNQVNSDMASDYAYNAMQVKMSFGNMSNLISENNVVLLEAMRSQIEELESNIQGQAQQDEVDGLKADYNKVVTDNQDLGLEPIE